ncbi:MAG TPA: patatin-like phospholipase family protein [Lamprocystis sp. (in: g-proteobacteria)]|nr:patatin-like phospholipase family protein [Lamprocystis sp. (in: g-proteobacteria)]
MNTAPTVSLVLGSGGARGLAHIGVIRWLESNGFAIRSVAGASIGALIGGVYAAGELDAFEHWVRALRQTDVLRLLDIAWHPSGLFKGERVIETLKGLVGDRNIEDLSIAFTAVATDVEAGTEVWLNRGPLFDAIRASIAVPTVFTPFAINGRRLLDGGLVNPIPIAPTLSDLTDLTIVVDAAGPRESAAATLAPAAPAPAPTELGELLAGYQRRIGAFIDEVQTKLGVQPQPTEQWGLGDVLQGSFETMQGIISRFKLAAYTPDGIVTIPRDAARAYEFHRADELIERGRREAGQALAHLIGPP